MGRGGVIPEFLSFLSLMSPRHFGRGLAGSDEDERRPIPQNRIVSESC